MLTAKAKYKHVKDALSLQDIDEPKTPDKTSTKL